MESIENMNNINYLLYPASIAILGASANLNKFSGRPLRFLIKHGYAGKIYPVNPKPDVKEILGVPCYHSLMEIGAPIDQVIIALPAKLVMDAMEECALLNIKSAVLFSSGFAEIGAEGKMMQEQIASIARSSNMAVCGPNCQGLINLNDNVISSFSNVLELEELVKGNVGFISQSGALAGSILSIAQQQRIGFSHWISVGNEAVLGVADFVKYLAADSATKVIATYVEGIKDANKWADALKCAAEAKKPVVVMKTGKSETGGRAIVSHTGSVAGEDFIVDAFFRQHKALRVNDISDMFDCVVMLSTNRRSGKGRSGILTSSGGAGILLADFCAQNDIELAKLSPVTTENLKKKLPKFASVLNPVDVTAQLFQTVFTQKPDLFKRCLEDMVSDEAVDILIVALTMLIGERAVKIAQDIAEVAAGTDKTIVVVWLAGNMAQEGYAVLKKDGIPLYFSASGCVSAIHHLITYHGSMEPNGIPRAVQISSQSNKTPTDALKIETARLQEPDRHLSAYDGRKILAQYNIMVPAGDLVRSEKEAMRLAEKLNFPLVLKIDSTDIPHKTEANCVFLNVQDEVELVTTYHQIMENARKYNPGVQINGILIEEMIKIGTGIEVIVGMKNDPILGPAIVFGLGGIFVEIFKEIVCKIAPLTQNDVADMVRSIKGYPIFEGVRGRPKLSLGALQKVLLNLSRLATDFCDVLAEIDINPLIVLEDGNGVVAADVLMIKKEMGP